MTEQEFIEKLHAYKAELISEVIPHYHAANVERGRFAFKRWKENLAQFLKANAPEEADRFEIATTHYVWLANPGEHPYDMFMREDGETCIAFIDEVVESTRRGRVRLSNAPSSQAAQKRTQPERGIKKIPNWVWIPAVILTTVLIAFLLVAYYKTPVMTPDQRNLNRFLVALLAGLSISFMSGTASLRVEFPKTASAKVGLAATAGSAVFFLVYLAPFVLPKPDKIENQFDYVGRVVDAGTNAPLHNAKVSVEQDRNIPQIYQTDSEGVFHLQLSSSATQVRLRVEAAGYEVFERIVAVDRSGMEDIRLTKVPMASPSTVTPVRPVERDAINSTTPIHSPSTTRSPTNPGWDLIERWIRESYVAGTKIDRIQKLDDPDCVTSCQKAKVVLTDSSNSPFSHQVTVKYSLVNGSWQHSVTKQ